MTKISLNNLGYDDFFEAERRRLGLANELVGRITAEYKELYRVKTEDKDYLARITGKHFFKSNTREDFPAVGDWVIVKELPDSKAVILEILPRKTLLLKKYSDKKVSQVIATNIDTAFIVKAIDKDYSVNRIERYLVLCHEAKIEPIIILNKIDLISETDLKQQIDKLRQRIKDIEVIAVSATTGNTINDMAKKIIKGKTYCFLGSSGVGKSTLINKLLGEEEIKTSEISMVSGKGKHTTTTREMYFLENGGILIDNPGTREVGLINSKAGIQDVFSEMISLSKHCKFANCSHVHEPGCAVSRALKEGALSEDKYLNYIKLKKESDFYEMTKVEKRKKDRKFGQFVKKAQENRL